MSDNAKEVTMIIDGKPVDFVRKDSAEPKIINVDADSSVASAAAGMKVLVRSRNEGVNAGIVEAADETGVILKNARRLWYHKPKDSGTSWYEGVAVSGLSDSSKVSTTVPRKFIIESYSMTECTSDTFEEIMKKEPYAKH